MIENNFEFVLDGDVKSATGVKVKLNGVELKGVTVIHPCKMPDKDNIGEITLTFRADNVKIDNKFSNKTEIYSNR